MSLESSSRGLTQHASWTLSSYFTCHWSRSQNQPHYICKALQDLSLVCFKTDVSDPWWECSTSRITTPKSVNFKKRKSGSVGPGTGGKRVTRRRLVKLYATEKRSRALRCSIVLPIETFLSGDALESFACYWVGRRGEGRSREGGRKGILGNKYCKSVGAGSLTREGIKKGHVSSCQRQREGWLRHVSGIGLESYSG